MGIKLASMSVIDPKRTLASRGLWNIAEFPSLRLDAGVLDHLSPLLGVVGDELAKVGGREREHDPTQVGKPCVELAVGEARVALFVEPVDDFSRRVLPSLA